MANLTGVLPLSTLDTFTEEITEMLAPYNPTYTQPAWSSVASGFIRTRDFNIGAQRYNMYATIRQTQLAFGIGNVNDFGPQQNCQANPDQITAPTWACIVATLGPPPSQP